MRMKKLMILAVAAIAMAACTKTYDKVETKDVNEIGFSTWNETLTKASVENTFDVNDNFKVWGEKLVSSTNTTVFNGVTVTKAASETETWNYSPKRYWDLSATSYTFYGIAPAADGYTVDAHTGAVSASPTITFTGKDSDILVAQQKVINKTAGSGNFDSFNKVPMVFNHVAALVDVKVKIASGLATAGAHVQVSAIELQNISTKGTFTVAGGYTTAPVASWTPSTASAETTDAFDSGEGFVIASSRLYTGLDASVVMPQDFRTSGDFIQKLDIDYNITQTGGSANNFTPDAFALTTFDNTDNTSNTGDTNVTGWAPGYHYTYVVTIDAHTIEFTASVNPWSVEGAAYHYLIN